MGRKNTNARPLAPASQDSPENLTTELEDGPGITAQAPGERDRATRVAAKHAPARVASRMYSQVHEVTDALDSAAVHLAKVALPAGQRAALLAQLEVSRAKLVITRTEVPSGVQDWAETDYVKAALAHQVAAANLLEPAISALLGARRTLDGAPAPDESTPAPLVELRAAVSAVLAAVEADRPGPLAASVARLRAATCDAFGANVPAAELAA